MGSMGRGGDSMVGHLTHGDVVIPRNVILDNPEFLTKFKKAMQDIGEDYRGHIAGSGYERINPETGAAEFWSLGGALSSVVKGVGHALSSGVKAVTPIMSNPLGIFGSLAGGNSLSNILSGAKQQVAPTSSSQAPQALMPPPDLGGADKPFAPKRGEEPTKPFDLFSRDIGGQTFGSLDPTQQRSYLATQGSSGGGIGDEDKNYYLGVLKRNLIDESGQMQNMNSSLLPVERNYLSRLGLPTDNTTDFFQALQS